MKMTITPFVIYAFGTVQSPKIGTRTGGLGSNETGGHCPIYSIVDIRQNIEKRPGDWRIAVTQIPVENHQLTLM